MTIIEFPIHEVDHQVGRICVQGKMWEVIPHTKVQLYEEDVTFHHNGDVVTPHECGNIATLDGIQVQWHFNQDDEVAILELQICD